MKRFVPPGAWLRVVAGCTLLALPATLGIGCSPEAARTGVGGFSPAAQARERADELFQAALDNVDRLASLNPDVMLGQVVARLNDWQLQAKPALANPPIALWETLAEDLRTGSAAQARDGARYTLVDAITLAETTWLTDVGNAAATDPTMLDRAASQTPLGRAVRSFDWVARNIGLDAEATGAPHPVWHTLLAGHGTVAERMAVLIRLGRQQGIDFVVLTRPERPPLVAALLDDPSQAGNAQLYLFDPTLGVAIPGPGDRGVATLAQAAADPAICTQLNADADRPYAWQSTDLTELTVLVEAAPEFVSGRLKAVEAKLTGNRRMVLHTDPDALAKRLQGMPGIGQVVAWEHPFRIEQPREAPQQGPGALAEATLAGAATSASLPKNLRAIPLRLLQGRILHLSGKFTGEASAAEAYLKCRTAEADLSVAQLSDDQRDLLRRAKWQASLWLGLMSYERGSFTTASDYLKNLDMPLARANLARALAAQNKPADAAALLESDESPTRLGSLWRARQLRASLAAAKGVAPGNSPP